MLDGRYKGYTTWERQPTKIETAILRNGGSELVIEFMYGEYRFTATLARKAPGEYSGKFSAQNSKDKYEGDASCDVFERGSDLILVGNWREDNCDYRWWAELQPPDQ